MSPLDPTTEARPHFPSLSSGFVFADSAGGSQCLASVAEHITSYLLETNVQLGASYPTSVQSGSRVSQGSEVTARLIGASSPKSIIYGSSSTQLVENLARAFEDTLVTGDEIVIAEEHEANVGPWANMARRLSRKGVDVEIRWWKHEGTVEGEDIRLSLKRLGELLGQRTRLVAFTACSNLLGELTDIKGVVDLVRTKSGGKAKTIADCVAYAPHRRLEVERWAVDFAFFSYYKVYGPHCSVLYAHPTAIAPLSSLAHFFLPLSPTDPYKLSPGGSSYELTYGSTAVTSYLLSLAGPSTLNQTDDERLDLAFERIAAHEELLAKLLLNFLRSEKMRERGVRIVGPKESGKDVRAPTISFVVRGAKATRSQAIVDEVTKGGKIGIRWGHFYAVRLVREVGINEEDGVVRISLVHYSTVDEVLAIIEALEQVLA